MFDTDGRLEESCREIWALIEPEKRAIARAYWERYAQSDEIARPISPEKLDELTDRIVPHIDAKHGALADPAWVEMTTLLCRGGDQGQHLADHALFGDHRLRPGRAGRAGAGDSGRRRRSWRG